MKESEEEKFEKVEDATMTALGVLFTGTANQAQHIISTYTDIILIFNQKIKNYEKCNSRSKM